MDATKNTEFKKTLQKVMVELLQERVNVIQKIDGEDYPEKETDQKCIEELDKVIQSVLYYLQNF